MMALSSLRRRRSDQSGQGLVEFALALPVFLLVVFALFDIGRFVVANSALSLAAREGARLGATEAAWIGLTDPACVTDASQIDAGRPGAHVCPRDVASFRSDVVDAVNGLAFTVGPVDRVYLSCNEGTLSDPAPSGAWTDSPGGGGNGCQDDSGNPVGISGSLVTVRVEHTFQPITPVISSIIESVSLGGSASMTAH